MVVLLKPQKINCYVIPYQIKSFEEYQEAYQRSVEDPEGFGLRLLVIFNGEKNGIRSGMEL